MASKAPQFTLYKSFVDAFMKGHPGMTKYVNIRYKCLLLLLKQ